MKSMPYIVGPKGPTTTDMKNREKWEDKMAKRRLIVRIEVATK